MERATILPNVEVALVQSGEALLKAFHSEYEKDPTGRDTEFWRGLFTGWRQALYTIFGESRGQSLIEKVSDNTKLTVPHGGPLSPDGGGYLGWDSGCHTYIGRIE